MSAYPSLERPPCQVRLLLLEQRPLVVYGIVAALCAGVGAKLSVSLPRSVMIGLLCPLALGMLIVLFLAVKGFLKHRRGWAAAIIGTAFVLESSAFCLMIQTHEVTFTQETFTGRVMTVEDSGQGYSQYTLQNVVLSNGKQFYGKMNIRAETNDRIVPGSHLSAEGDIEPIQGSAFPAGMDWRTWYWAQGVTHSCYNPTVTNIKPPSPVSFYGVSNSLLRYIRHSLQTHMPDGAPRELAYSLLTGRDDLLSEDIQDNFTLLGILHILSVSGFNVVMTAGTAFALASRFKAKPAIASLISLAVLLLYCVISGLAPSVLRAGIMWVVFLFAGVLGRRYDPLAAWAAALFAVVALNPLDVGTVGFQLSFLATAGIILLYTPLHQNLPQNIVGRYLLSSAGISVCAQAATQTAMLSSFNTTTIFAMLANLLFIPPISLALLGVILLLMFAWVPFFAGALGYCLDLFIAFFIRLSALLAPHAPQVQAGRPDILISFVYITLLLMLSPMVAALGKKSRQVTAVLFAVVAAAMLFHPPLAMAFPREGIIIRESEGNSLLYREDGELVLVCSGEAANAAEFLKSAGIFTIDKAVMAARDPNENLLFSLQGIEVQKVYLPDEWLDEPLARLKRDCTENSVELLGFSDPDSPVSYLKAGEEEESSVAVVMDIGKARAVYVPNLSAESFDQIASQVDDCNIAVFGTGTNRAGNYARQLGAKIMVVRQNVEDAGVKSYNIYDCGSILLENAAGGLSLGPWIAGGS